MTWVPAVLAAVLIGTAALPANAAGPGLESQVYPAGVTLTGFVWRALGDGDRLIAHAGGNWTRRRDFGRHDDERGSGPGLGVAWRRGLSSSGAGWQLGVRADAWFLSIDWRDDSPPRSGRTEIVVLQPTAQIAYRFAVAERLVLEPVVSLGAEVNVRTDGEEVGEGAIFLVGIGAAWGTP